MASSTKLRMDSSGSGINGAGSEECRYANFIATSSSAAFTDAAAAWIAAVSIAAASSIAMLAAAMAAIFTASSAMCASGSVGGIEKFNGRVVELETSLLEVRRDVKIYTFNLVD